MAGAYNRYIYTHFFYNFNTIFTNYGITLPSPPTISQRSSISDSLMCTSNATSIGDPGSCGVGCLREWPSAVASESDCRSSYASLSSSPMTASQSRKCRHLFGSCSSSWPILLTLLRLGICNRQLRVQFLLFLFFLL